GRDFHIVDLVVDRDRVRGYGTTHRHIALAEQRFRIYVHIHSDLLGRLIDDVLNRYTVAEVDIAHSHARKIVAVNLHALPGRSGLEHGSIDAHHGRALARAMQLH